MIGQGCLHIEMLEGDAVRIGGCRFLRTITSEGHKLEGGDLNIFPGKHTPNI